MQSKVESWDKRQLSKGGKEIMLKTVAQSLPTYTMSVFLIPHQLCKDMERIMSRYWWNNSAGKEKGMHWTNGANLCKKKSNGGLGFRDMHDFNLALLGKQGWRLFTQPNSLVSRMYKARYYLKDSFLTAKIGANPSYVWRSVIETQEILKSGMACRVGSGKTISILKDPWLLSMENSYVQTNHEALTDRTVDSLMCTESTQWDVDLINDIFTKRDANLILSIPLQRTQDDSWYWKEEKMGFYSVKSAYALIRKQKEFQQSRENSRFWCKIWNLKIPLKVKHFLWRAASGTLPTKDLLLSRRVQVCNLCPICNVAYETVAYVLLSRDFTCLCWEKTSLMRNHLMCSNFAEWLLAVFRDYNAEDVRIICMVCWSLWKN